MIQNMDHQLVVNEFVPQVQNFHRNRKILFFFAVSLFHIKMHFQVKGLGCSAGVSLTFSVGGQLVFTGGQNCRN